jgi:hypothetical protein
LAIAASLMTAALGTLMVTAAAAPAPAHIGALQPSCQDGDIQSFDGHTWVCIDEGWTIIH